MAQLQDLVPGGQQDTWGDVLETNLVSLNTELESTTARSNSTNTGLAELRADLESGKYGNGGAGTGAVGSSENYHTSLTATRNPNIPYNWWFSPAGTVPDGYVDGDILIVSTTTHSPPPQVTGLTLSDITSTSVVATWLSALNADEYEVQYKKTADTTWVVAGLTTALTMKISGLAEGTSYDFRIRGSNAAGFGSPSDVKTTTTPSTLVYVATFDSSLENWRARDTNVTSISHDATAGELVFALKSGTTSETSNVELAKENRFAVEPNTTYTLTYTIKTDDTDGAGWTPSWVEFTSTGGYISVKNVASQGTTAANVTRTVVLTATTSATCGAIQPYLIGHFAPANVNHRLTRVEVKKS